MPRIPAQSQSCLQVTQMTQNDAIPRSDRVLFTALAIFLATASAAVGSAMTWHRAPPPAPPARVAQAAAPLPPQKIDLDIPAADLLAEHQCLSEAIYYEARGEGPGGEQAVAEVVLRRLGAGRFGHSICAVVYEGMGHPGCQFSFPCDNSMHHVREAAAWRDAEQLATEILIGAVTLGNATGGAINYHAVSVSPYWAPTLKKTTQIGNHIFYRNGSHTENRAEDRPAG